MATELKILYIDRETGQPAYPAWLRGYKQASAYAGLKDKRHRKLKEWMEDGLVHTFDGDEPMFRCQWIDAYIERNGLRNRHSVTEQLIREG